MSGNVRMIETLGHLPECPYNPDDPVSRWASLCLCDRLRACEARVNDEWVRDFGGHRAFAMGLDAAQDAVAALQDPNFHWAAASDGACGIQVGYEHALAAIDALRNAQSAAPEPHNPPGAP